MPEAKEVEKTEETKTEESKAPDSSPAKFKSGPWKTGLFDCFKDMNVCLATYCCGCFVEGKNADLAGMEKTLVAPYWDHCLASLVPCLGQYCVCQVAQKVIEQDGVKVDPVCLCLESVCCGACVVCRTHRELLMSGKETGPGLMDKYGPPKGAAAPDAEGDKAPNKDADGDKPEDGKGQL